MLLNIFTTSVGIYIPTFSVVVVVGGGIATEGYRTYIPYLFPQTVAIALKHPDASWYDPV